MADIHANAARKKFKIIKFFYCHDRNMIDLKDIFFHYSTGNKGVKQISFQGINRF